ncbi:pyrroloquinoline quinone precursor peptide PqqA [Denitromonas ohlonensis]|uniref:pyrroloquinoline quinone precursor peptide PqqA n=1 Tax=Denitromonas ohlonensis TaxID=3078508 RepID=UPI0037046E43
MIFCSGLRQMVDGAPGTWLPIMVSGTAWGRAAIEETHMTWETPAYCEIRLGFEVTAYVYVR